MQGQPARAMQVARDSVARAEKLGHAISLCFALQMACMIAAWCGDRSALLHYAGMLHDQSRRNGLPKWEFWGLAFLTSLRDCDNNGRLARESLATLTQDAFCGDWHMDVLATMHPSLLTPRALARAEAGLAGWCQAEVLRAWGESLLRIGERDRAEELFLRALGIAQAQNALSWELRIASSLARLWRDTPRAEEGLSLLRAVYGRFSEGHDTADLRGAAELLAG
jgi:hypothetical protein